MASFNVSSSSSGSSRDSLSLSLPPLCPNAICWGLLTRSWRNSWSIQILSPTSFSLQRISILICSRRLPISCTMNYTTVTACVCSGSQSGWPEKISQALSGQTMKYLLSMIDKLRFQRDLQSLVSINVKIRNFYLNLVRISLKKSQLKLHSSQII